MRRRRFLIAGPMFLAACRKSAGPRVVCYCAQDREFAEAIFADYQATTGVEIAARYDSEAAKSVGLAEDLIGEEGRPRCDVWWNNEPLQTIRLARLGMLESLPQDLRQRLPRMGVGPERPLSGLRGAGEGDYHAHADA